MTTELTEESEAFITWTVEKEDLVRPRLAFIEAAARAQQEARVAALEGALRDTERTPDDAPAFAAPAVWYERGWQDRGDAIRALWPPDRAALTPPAPGVAGGEMRPHPGEPHHFLMTCEDCGEPGYVTLSLTAPGETVTINPRPEDGRCLVCGLSPTQWLHVPEHVGREVLMLDGSVRTGHPFNQPPAPAASGERP